ncbi:MAG: VanZ family protein [Clostridiales bacterium]|nr:VanZ family protein [Clostridiales bacterium]
MSPHARARRQPGWICALLWLIVLGTMAGIFAFSAQEGDASWSSSGRVTRTIIAVIQPDYPTFSAHEQTRLYETVQLIVRKGAHFLEYAWLGFWLFWLANAYALDYAAAIAWMAGTLYAAGDELHQLFVSSRAASWRDIGLDAAGVLAGAGVAWLAARLWRRRRLRRRQG